MQFISANIPTETEAKLTLVLCGNLSHDKNWKGCLDQTPYRRNTKTVNKIRDSWEIEIDVRSGTSEESKPAERISCRQTTKPPSGLMNHHCHYRYCTDLWERKDSVEDFGNTQRLTAGVMRRDGNVSDIRPGDTSKTSHTHTTAKQTTTHRHTHTTHCLH